MMNLHTGGAATTVVMKGCNNGRYPRNSLYSDCIIEEKAVVLQKKDNEGFGFVLRGAKGMCFCVCVCNVHGHEEIYTSLNISRNYSWCTWLLDNRILCMLYYSDRFQWLLSEAVCVFIQEKHCIIIWGGESFVCIFTVLVYVIFCP